MNAGKESEENAKRRLAIVTSVTNHQDSQVAVTSTQSIRLREPSAWLNGVQGEDGTDPTDSILLNQRHKSASKRISSEIMFSQSIALPWRPCYQKEHSFWMEKGRSPLRRHSGTRQINPNQANPPDEQQPIRYLSSLQPGGRL